MKKINRRPVFFSFVFYNYCLIAYILSFIFNFVQIRKKSKHTCKFNQIDQKQGDDAGRKHSYLTW